MSTYPDTVDSQRDVTAHHEAGHAVAAVSRGGSSLLSVSLDDDGLGGLTRHRSRPFDHGFIAYAGQWAEAQYGHRAGVLPGGMSADDYLRRGWESAQDDAALEIFDDDADHDDWAIVVGSVHELVGMVPAEHRPDIGQVLAGWARELSSMWPAIGAVAARLLDGQVLADADVRALIEDSEQQ